jgi:hypothetical protein
MVKPCPVDAREIVRVDRAQIRALNFCSERLSRWNDADPRLFVGFKRFTRHEKSGLPIRFDRQEVGALAPTIESVCSGASATEASGPKGPFFARPRLSGLKAGPPARQYHSSVRQPNQSRLHSDR